MFSLSEIKTEAALAKNGHALQLSAVASVALRYLLEKERLRPRYLTSSRVMI